MTLFTLYQKRDYLERYYFYEKKLHQERLVFLKNIKMLGALNSRHRETSTVIQQLNNLFDLILSIGSLRYRIKDHAVLEVEEQEFFSISNNLSILLRKLAKSQEITDANIESLKDAVLAFDSVYRAALQVSVENPIVYFIFMQNIEWIADELLTLSNSRH